MAEERKIPVSNAGQNIFVENREKIRVSGVVDVRSFDENCVYIETELGELLIRGENLRINKLNLEQFELVIEGYIVSFEYDEKGKRNGKGLLGRMFK